jgi:menaquinone-dependent protoporphyrinogen IX oxidase
MSAQEVATAFVQHYYTTMDSNPSALASLYVSAATHPLTHSLTH